MPSKVFLMAVLVSLPAIAHAESPAPLLDIAPFCRSVVKASFAEQDGGSLIFQVERVYTGSPPPQLRVPVAHWRQAWGDPSRGFEGFFVYGHNPEVDSVFPVVKDKVLADPVAGSPPGEMQAPFWLPLSEVEKKLSEVARRRCALVLTFSTSEENPTQYQVVFTNGGEEPMAVNRGGHLEYLVSDTKGKPLSQTIKPRNGPLADDYVELQPGDSTAVEAPAELLAGVAAGWVQVRVTYSNSNAGGGPADWYGTRETHAWIRSSGPDPRPASTGFSQPGTVVNAPAPSYTELAARARVQGDVRVNVTILPTGEVAKTTMLGEGQPMGLSAASVEAAQAWRFAKSEIERTQEIVFEFRVVGDCDPEPPPFEWTGGYHLRVWAPRMRLPRVRYVLTFDKNGEAHCDAATRQVPQCDS